MRAQRVVRLGVTARLALDALVAPADHAREQAHTALVRNAAGDFVVGQHGAT
jgi:hypothetical protein